MEQVLEACAEIASLRAGLPVVRERTVKAVREIFKADVSGIIVREGEGYHDAAVCSDADDPVGAKALIEHARPYATRAIEQNQQVSFKFSYCHSQTEAIYHGLAQPILTTGSAAVLLMVRKTAFTVAEISAFGAIGNMGRMALDNSELASLYGAKSKSSSNYLKSPPISGLHAWRVFSQHSWYGPPIF